MNLPNIVQCIQEKKCNRLDSKSKNMQNINFFTMYFWPFLFHNLFTILSDNLAMILSLCFIALVLNFQTSVHTTQICTHFRIGPAVGLQTSKRVSCNVSTLKLVLKEMDRNAKLRTTSGTINIHQQRSPLSFYKSRSIIILWI